jgi:hypothetical protein
MLLQQWPLFDFFLASWHRGCNLVAPGPTFRKYPQLPKLRPCYSCWGPGIDVPRLPLGLLWTKSGGMLHMMLPVRSWLGTYFGGFDRDFNLILSQEIWFDHIHRTHTGDVWNLAPNMLFGWCFFGMFSLDSFQHMG